MTVIASDGGEVSIQLSRVCFFLSSLCYVRCMLMGFGISGCEYCRTVCGDYWESSGLHDDTDADVHEFGARTRCVCFCHVGIS
jgi:hypothetical protein